MSATMRTRVMHIISRHRDGNPKYGKRFTAEQQESLLAFAATVPDETILNDWHQTGPATLRWIRDHQPSETPVPIPGSRVGDTFAEVIKTTGWYVEMFWNESAHWFTARLVSRVNRDGARDYAGGYLVPFEDPIGASGATPGEALANLSEAVLEWA